MGGDTAEDWQAPSRSLDDGAGHEPALWHGQARALSHRPGSDESVNTGGDQMVDVFPQRVGADLTVLVKGRGYRWDDSGKTHSSLQEMGLIRRQLRSWGEDEGVVLDASIEVEHIESALKLVEQGLGNSYVLRSVYESTSFPSALAVVPFVKPIYDTYALIWRKDHKPSPATAELIAMARQLMAGYAQPVAQKSETSDALAVRAPPGT